MSTGSLPRSPTSHQKWRRTDSGRNGVRASARNVDEPGKAATAKPTAESQSSKCYILRSVYSRTLYCNLPLLRHIEKRIVDILRVMKK